MKKVSIQRLSFLGLVLLAASAVTAAVIPSNKRDTTSFAGNSLTASDDGDAVSCATTAGAIGTPCTNTVSCGEEPLSFSTVECGGSSGQTSD